MVTIGSGNTGMLLATMFSKHPILFSTAHQDTANYSGHNVNAFSEDGAGKRFRDGAKIWIENFEKVEKIFDGINNDKVVIFSSLGGGSGSSSLYPISKILVDNNNKVLIIGVLPFKKELNPPLANAVQAINSLMPVISKVSVFIFDNQKLKKDHNNNWGEINNFIIKKTDYLVNLLKKYSTDDFSPMTIDQSELDSVIFGGGFLDLSDTFLEEKMPKFEYGALDKTTKNCLIAMYVDTSVKTKKKLREYQNTLMSVIDRVSGRIKNARLIPGILRAKVNYSNAIENEVKDRAYIVIASGLNIDRYIKKVEKIKNMAVERASVFAEEYKGSKFIDRKASKILDI